MNRLAQELIDEIIDQWRLIEPNSMKPCGLIGRQWLTRSRHHLFSSVSLSSKNLHSFISLLDTFIVPILPSIRLLTLCYQGKSHNRSHLNRLHNCPNLVTITLKSTPSVGGGLTIGRWLGSAGLQGHLRAWSEHSSFPVLCIDMPSGGRDKMVEMATVAGLLSSVPSLESLTMQNICIINKSPLPTFTPSRLTFLDLTMAYGAEIFCTWLGSLHEPPSIQSFGYFISDPKEALLIESYFQRAGSSLNSLMLAVDEIHPCKWFPLQAALPNKLTFTWFRQCRPAAAAHISAHTQYAGHQPHWCASL
jgi:hypothetical protein